MRQWESSSHNHNDKLSFKTSSQYNTTKGVQVSESLKKAFGGALGPCYGWRGMNEGLLVHHWFLQSRAACHGKQANSSRASYGAGQCLAQPVPGCMG